MGCPIYDMQNGLLIFLVVQPKRAEGQAQEVNIANWGYKTRGLCRFECFIILRIVEFFWLLNIASCESVC